MARSFPLMLPPVLRFGGLNGTLAGATGGRVPGCGRGGLRSRYAGGREEGETARLVGERSGMGGLPIASRRVAVSDEALGACGPLEVCVEMRKMSIQEVAESSSSGRGAAGVAQVDCQCLKRVTIRKF